MNNFKIFHFPSHFELKEIERLKQMKANLILQQQIKGTAQRNILNFFEENSKEQTVKTLHK